MTKTLVKASEERPAGLAVPAGRRIPGRAVATNPLAAVVACVTAEHVADLELEISATENYLAGLRAMYSVAKVAVGTETPAEPEPAPAPVAVQETVTYVKSNLPPKPPEPVEEKVAHVPKNPPHKPTEPAAMHPPKSKPGPKLGTKRATDDNSPTNVIRAILKATPDKTITAIIAELRGRWPGRTDEMLRAIIYNVKSEIKRATSFAESTTPALKTRPLHGTVEPQKPVDTAVDAEDEDEEIDLRREVAEYIFKQGLVYAADVIKECGVPRERVGQFMNHPWFEYVEITQRWRLTAKGKAEGVSY